MEGEMEKEKKEKYTRKINVATIRKFEDLHLLCERALSNLKQKGIKKEAHK